MIPACTVVNVSEQCSSWLLNLIHAQHATTNTFSISTKYFNAQVRLQHVTEAAAESCAFTETEALLLYGGQGTKASLAAADKVWSRAKEHGPPVCLLIVDSTTEKVDDAATQVSRTDLLAWCLTNQFELVECDETAEEEEEEGELVGKDRIMEALRSHTWSSMELLEPTDSASAKRDDTKEEEKMVEASMNSFESLFADLALMKEKAEGMSAGDRRVYAEQVAMAFYAAMGGSDDDEVEDDGTDD